MCQPPSQYLICIICNYLMSSNRIMHLFNQRKHSQIATLCEVIMIIDQALTAYQYLPTNINTVHCTNNWCTNHPGQIIIGSLKTRGHVERPCWLAWRQIVLRVSWVSWLEGARRPRVVICPDAGLGVQVFVKIDTQSLPLIWPILYQGQL